MILAGCYALQQCLVRKDCNISLLNLSWNAIGSKGGLAISDALEVSIQLLNFDIITFLDKQFLGEFAIGKL
jgi:hypothetical protein